VNTPPLDIRYRVRFEGDPPVGRLEFFGDGCEALTGYTAAEIMADPQLWMGVMHPDDRDELIHSTSQLLLLGSSDVRIYRMRHRDTQDYRRVEDVVTVITAVDGSVTGYTATVTEQNL
jgi:PAS domain-containing protein